MSYELVNLMHDEALIDLYRVKLVKLWLPVLLHLHVHNEVLLNEGLILTMKALNTAFTLFYF